MFNKLTLSTLLLNVTLNRGVHAISSAVPVTKPDSIQDWKIYKYAFQGVCQNFRNVTETGLQFQSTQLGYHIWEEPSEGKAPAWCRYSDTRNNNAIVLFTKDVAESLGGGLA